MTKTFFPLPLTPSRVTTSAPPAIYAALQAIAKREGLSVESVQRAALAHFVRAYQARRINLTPCKAPSGSPRFRYVLEDRALVQAAGLTTKGRRK